MFLVYQVVFLVDLIIAEIIAFIILSIFNYYNGVYLYHTKLLFLTFESI